MYNFRVQSVKLLTFETIVLLHHPEPEQVVNFT